MNFFFLYVLVRMRHNRDCHDTWREEVEQRLSLHFAARTRCGLSTGSLSYQGTAVRSAAAPLPPTLFQLLCHLDYCACQYWLLQDTTLATSDTTKTGMGFSPSSQTLNLFLLYGSLHPSSLSNCLSCCLKLQPKIGSIFYQGLLNGDNLVVAIYFA